MPSRDALPARGPDGLLYISRCGAWIEALGDFREQSLRGILDQIEYLIEAARSAVIRIRYHLPARARRVLQEELDLVLVAFGTQRAQVRVVFIVHRQHVIEANEVVPRRLAPAQPADVDAAARDRRLRALIRRLADVIRVRAGRVHFD